MESTGLIIFNTLLSITMIIIGIILIVTDVKYEYLGIAMILIFIILILIHIKNIYEIVKSLKNGEKFSDNFGLLIMGIGILFIIIIVFEIYQNKNKK